MKERPILFSAPMVRALLDGSKTQTRRIVKPTHLPVAPYEATIPEWALAEMIASCPYGQPGDRLWVRETWAHVPKEDGMGYIYRADGESAFDDIREGWEFTGPWKPSIFCKREASRITLEITAVRVERLQEISEEDAKAEGVEWTPFFNEPVNAYAALWNSINGPGSWDANPFVWVIEFRRL